MIKNPIRQDVTFTLVEDDAENEFVARPTLVKIAAIEAKLGPVVPLINRLLTGTVGVGEMCDLVALILRGVEHAPKHDDIREQVFARGAFTYTGPCADFLSEAIKTGAADAAIDADAGAGN